MISMIFLISMILLFQANRVIILQALCSHFIGLIE